MDAPPFAFLQNPLILKIDIDEPRHGEQGLANEGHDHPIGVWKR